jgi:hypothetical protein
MIPSSGPWIACQRGVVLRLGLLDGPGTGFDQPMRDFGATLHVSGAGRALLAAVSPQRHLQRLP